MYTPRQQISNFIDRNLAKQREKYNDGYKNNLFEWEDEARRYKHAELQIIGLQEEIGELRKQIRGLELDINKLKKG